MIIISADDWGRSREETEAIVACHSAGRITSVSAMVFMEDSVRAADLAKDMGIDVGLHLNLTQPFSASVNPQRLISCHEKIVRFLSSHKSAHLIYNPRLCSAFEYVYRMQYDEFVRIYGRPPSHIDGHHHKHLCANILLGDVIPAGEKVRRNFYFWPGEKGAANRMYRRVSDWILCRRYRSTDFFFALSQCGRAARLERVAQLANSKIVEIMTHPANALERELLMGDAFHTSMGLAEKGTYASI